MNHRAPRVTGGVAGLITAAVLVAGCNTSTGGTANPSPSGTSPSSTASNGESSNGAPDVPDPLDVSKFDSAPCAVLTDTQLKSAGFKPNGPGKPDSTAGKGCVWNDDELSATLNVALATLDPNGLSDLYGQKSDAAYFEPSTVQGYPAVRMSLNDARTSGICTMYVGASNKAAVQVSFVGTSKVGTTSCDHADKVANELVTALKGGS